MTSTTLDYLQVRLERQLDLPIRALWARLGRPPSPEWLAVLELLEGEPPSVAYAALSAFLAGPTTTTLRDELARAREARLARVAAALKGLVGVEHAVHGSPRPPPTPKAAAPREPCGSDFAPVATYFEAYKPGQSFPAGHLIIYEGCVYEAKVGGRASEDVRGLLKLLKVGEEQRNGEIVWRKLGSIRGLMQTEKGGVLVTA